MPHVAMHHAVEPKKVLLKKIGDISKYEIFNNQVLVAVYVRPELTAGGIILDTKEDEHQSKVGLVIAMGNDACEDATGRWFRGLKRKVAVGDWILFRPSDGWPLLVNKTMCRMLDDTNLKGRVPHPDAIY